MKWTKIDENNLPEHEVLAANFKPKTHGFKEKIIGHLGIDSGTVICDDGHQILDNITHYIDINKFDIKKP